MLNRWIQAPGARPTWHRYLAEAMGTFAIVFVGCGAVIADHFSGGAVTHVGISAAFGAVVAAMIFALGPVSAAHFNPAVTFGFAIAGRFGWRHVGPYWGMQLLGACLASGAHALLFPTVSGEAVHFGATASTLVWWKVVGIEAIFTWFLMVVIMAVATDRRVSGVVPALAIGLAVAMGALAGGPLTGASMNPARSLGPALIAGGDALAQLVLYVAGPMLGALFAAVTYEVLRDDEAHAQSAPDITH